MIESKVKVVTHSFPKLMTDGVHIVLFNENKTGIVVGKITGGTSSTDYRRDIGDVSSEWFLEEFKDFTGEVTLSNQGQG